MTAPKVLGLDLSLTCTGVAGNGWTDTIEPVKRRADFRDRKDPIRDAQLRTAYNHGRLNAIRERLADFVFGADLIVIEGIAYAAKDTERQIAGLNWMARQWLWNWGFPYAVVPPYTLKHFVTGIGDADKDLVTKFIADWFPWFDGGHDEADAAGLMAMGYAHLGMPLGPMLDHQVTALSKAQWPDVARPVVAPFSPSAGVGAHTGNLPGEDAA
ncbi:hypothetical protein MED01_004253 [Micromonospora sp. MED01]|uniref:hypothetical protein n=1 Tax=Micromonospora alfalfae TaxID=2911212 RepID=UPI001EE8CCB5|nr:hypothetical protein [Micromonospora alfalfae]MCG5460827.1 hypothetical protein [Micromonospora alfalfae]